MTEPRIHHRIIRNRKKSAVPLSKLRTSDAVKTVVDHPRRLEELLRMLEDKDRGVRGRAAATIAKLSESHPTRLFRVTALLKNTLADDSAYVRWHLVYTLGILGSRFPSRSHDCLGEIVSRLDDDNRIVRIIASKALVQSAIQKPLMIEKIFHDLNKEIPPAIARVMRHSTKKNNSK